MKIKVTKRFYDKEAKETIAPKKTIERSKERGEEIIKAGYGEEVKETPKKKTTSGKKSS